MLDLRTVPFYKLNKYVEDSKELLRHIYGVYHLSSAYCALSCVEKLIDELEDLSERLEEEEVEEDEE